MNKNSKIDTMEQEYDLLFEGEAERAGSYPLELSLGEYRAVIVEIGLFDGEGSTISRQYRYIPLQETDSKYIYLAHESAKGNRWYIEWSFPQAEELYVENAKNATSLYAIKITRIFGVKSGAEVNSYSSQWGGEPEDRENLKRAMGLENVDNTPDAVKEVAFAVRAERDANGDIIQDTYLKKIELEDVIERRLEEMKDDDLLNSMTEIKANKKFGKFAGALAVKSLSKRGKCVKLAENEESRPVIIETDNLSKYQFFVLAVYTIQTNAMHGASFIPYEVLSTGEEQTVSAYDGTSVFLGRCTYIDDYHISMHAEHFERGCILYGF